MMRPKLGALAVVVSEGRVLLVQRAKAPDVGLWGFAGGHVEWGETVSEAAVRELREETGLSATPVTVLGWDEAITRDEHGTVTHHFALAAVLLGAPQGTAKAADDAAALGWFTLDEIATLPCSARVGEVAEAAMAWGRTG